MQSEMPVTPRRLIAFLALVFGMFMAILDIQIVSASLSEIQAGLNAGAEIYAIYEGYEGMVAGGRYIRPLAWFDVGGILQQGGHFVDAHIKLLVGEGNVSLFFWLWHPNDGGFVFMLRQMTVNAVV